MLKNWKIPYDKDSISSLMQCSPWQNINRFFLSETWQIDFEKLYGNAKEIVKTLLKKKNIVRGLVLLNIKSYYKVGIEIACCWCKDIRIDWWKK